MDQTRFKIIFDGEIMPGVPLEQAKNNLASLFKSPIERIGSLFSGAPVTLKRDLTEDEARQYQTALENAGARVRMEADLAANLSLVSIEEQDTEAPKPPMTCPKCGHEQSQASECSACGVVIEKYVARQAQLAEQGSATDTSPYTPPRAQSASQNDEVGELKVWGISGRIGRLRYLAWSFVVMLALMPLYMVGVGALMASEVLGAVVLGVVVIAAVVISVQIGVKRLHDIGWSGWLLLLNLIPIVGSIFALIMLVAPGTPGRNGYGAQPPANSTGVLVLAWLLLGTMILGIVAAIAIPVLMGLS